MPPKIPSTRLFSNRRAPWSESFIANISGSFRKNFEASIFYGLGNYFQKKNKTKSEEFYIKANDKIFSIARYNSHQYQENIILIIENYLKFFNQENLFNETKGNQNFFIIGSPRSGTTLVESIITSNISSTNECGV